MEKKRSHHGGGKIGPDGLTEKERAFVALWLADPQHRRTKASIAIEAGYSKNGACTTACTILKATRIKLAIAAGTRDPKTGKKPVITREWVQEQMQVIYDDPRTTIGDKIKLLDKLGASTKGFYVPVGVEHSGALTLEGLLGQMGARPDETYEGDNAPDKETLQ